MSEFRWMITYDVSSNHRRYRVERKLQTCASRIQKSVFEAALSPTAQRELFLSIKKLIDPRTDDIRFYRLCHWCNEAAILLGVDDRVADTDYYVF